MFAKYVSVFRFIKGNIEGLARSQRWPEEVRDEKVGVSKNKNI